jgi:hypothetical protein
MGWRFDTSTTWWWLNGKGYVAMHAFDRRSACTAQEVGGRKSREIDLPIKLRSERGPTDLTFERVSSSTSVLRPQNSPI